MEPEKRVDKVSRTIRAKPAAVYRAFVDRDALLAWLPPQGMTATFAHFDARVGGGYRMTLTYSDGNHGKSSSKTDVINASFVAMDESERVVQDVIFESDKPELAGTMRMTWAIEARGDTTNVTFTAENVPAGIKQEDHLEGMAASLQNLAALLESD